MTRILVTRTSATHCHDLDVTLVVEAAACTVKTPSSSDDPSVLATGKARFRRSRRRDFHR